MVSYPTTCFEITHGTQIFAVLLFSEEDYKSTNTLFRRFHDVTVLYVPMCTLTGERRSFLGNGFFILLITKLAVFMSFLQLRSVLACCRFLYLLLLLLRFLFPSASYIASCISSVFSRINQSISSISFVSRPNIIGQYDTLAKGSAALSKVDLQLKNPLSASFCWKVEWKMGVRSVENEEYDKCSAAFPTL